MPLWDQQLLFYSPGVDKPLMRETFRFLQSDIWWRWGARLEPDVTILVAADFFAFCTKARAKFDSPRADIGWDKEIETDVNRGCRSNV